MSKKFTTRVISKKLKAAIVSVFLSFCLVLGGSAAAIGLSAKSGKVSNGTLADTTAAESSASNQLSEKIEPDLTGVGAGEKNLPEVIGGTFQGTVSIGSWTNLKIYIEGLSAGTKVIVSMLQNMTADSTITVPRGVNVTLTSPTTTINERRTISRKVTNDPTTGAVDLTTANATFLENFFRVGDGATLSIQYLELNGSSDKMVDAKGAGVFKSYALVDVRQGGLFYLEEEGILTKQFLHRNDNRSAGGAVWVDPSAVFIMDGGEISYCWVSTNPTDSAGNTIDTTTGGGDNIIAVQGGAVFVAREGMRISNYAVGSTVSGTAVAIPGTGRGKFYMFGGNIHHNQGARNGSAVVVGGDVYVDGGRISYNQGSHEPVFYVAGPGQDYAVQEQVEGAVGGRGRVEINSGEFDHNYSPSVMISAIYGSMVINNADIHDNSGAQGCFYISGVGSSITINGGRYYNNNSTNFPFVNCLAGCNATVNDCLVYNNTGTTGPIYLGNGTCVVNGGEFYNNTINGNGGAVCVANGSCTVTGGYFHDNSATANGGAIYIGNGSLNINGGVFENNTAGGEGGAAYVNGGNMTMVGGTLTKNTATTYPGFYCNKEVFVGGSIQIKDNKTSDGTARNIYLAKADATVTVIKPLDNAYLGITKTIVEGQDCVVAIGGEEVLSQEIDDEGHALYTRVADGVVVYKVGNVWYTASDDQPIYLPGTEGDATPSYQAYTVGTDVEIKNVVAREAYTMQDFDALCCYCDAGDGYLFSVQNNQIVLSTSAGHVHTWKNYEVKPSCDDQGYLMHVCTGCHEILKWKEGDDYNGVKLNAANPNHAAIIGTERIEYFAPLGHKFVWDATQNCFVCNEEYTKVTGETVTCGEKLFLGLDEIDSSVPYKTTAHEPAITGYLYQVFNGTRIDQLGLAGDVKTVTYANNVSVTTGGEQASVTVKFTVDKSKYTTLFNYYYPTGEHQGEAISGSRVNYTNTISGTITYKFDIVNAPVSVVLNAPSIPTGQTAWYTDDGATYFGGVEITASINEGAVVVSDRGSILWENAEGEFVADAPALKAGTNTYNWKWQPSDSNLQAVTGTHTVENVVLLVPTALNVTAPVVTPTLYDNQSFDDIKGNFTVVANYNKGNVKTLDKADYNIWFISYPDNQKVESVVPGTYFIAFSYELNGTTVTAQTSNAFTVVSVQMLSISAAIKDGATVYDTYSLEDLRDHITVTGTLTNFTTEEITAYTLNCDDWLLKTPRANTYTVKIGYGSEAEGTYKETTLNVPVAPNGVKDMEIEWENTAPAYTSSDVNDINSFGNLSVVVSYLDGSTKNVPISRPGVNGYVPTGDLSVAGDEVPVTLTYAEANSSGTVLRVSGTIKLVVLAVEFDHIETALKSGQKYFRTDNNDTLMQKLDVVAVFNDGSKQSLAASENVNPAEGEFIVDSANYSSRTGKLTYTVVYFVGGTEGDMQYSLVPEEPKIDHITVDASRFLPDDSNVIDTQLLVTHDLEFFGTKITVKSVKDNGEEAVVPYADLTLSLPAAQNGVFIVGNNTITIGYTDDDGNAFSTTVTVPVAAVGLQSIKIEGAHKDADDEEGPAYDYRGDGTTLKDGLVFTSTQLADIKKFLTVTGVYSDGSENELQIFQFDVTGTLNEGLQTLTVTTKDSDGKTFNQDFTVKVSAVTIESIAAEFTQGETVIYAITKASDLLGNIVVTATYNDGSTQEIHNGFTAEISGGAFVESGANSITVSYQGKSCTATGDITVTAKAFDKLVFTSTQGSAVIYASAPLDDSTPNGIVRYITLAALYNDGTSETLEFAATETEGYYYTLSGDLAEGTVKANYKNGDESASCDITLDVTALSVTAIKDITPDPVEGYYASSGVNGLKSYITVTATYNDGVDRVLDADDYIITGTLIADTETVMTVTCGTRTKKFNVSCAAYGVADVVDIVTTQDETTVIYESAKIADLKQYIEVYVDYDNNGDKHQKLDDKDYTISGDLSKGEIYVTVATATAGDRKILLGSLMTDINGDPVMDVTDPDNPVQKSWGNLVITKVVPLPMDGSDASGHKGIEVTYNQTVEVIAGQALNTIVPDIKVVAYYNDGTSKTLSYVKSASEGDGYTLSGIPQAEGSTTVNNITVSYTYNGTTVSDTIQVDVDPVQNNGALVEIVRQLPTVYASSIFNTTTNADGEVTAVSVNVVGLNALLGSTDAATKYLDFKLHRNNGDTISWGYQLEIVNKNAYKWDITEEAGVAYTAAELLAIYHGEEADGTERNPNKVVITAVGTQDDTTKQWRATFEVEVVPVTVTSITVDENTEATVYTSATGVDLAKKFIVTAHYNDGTDRVLTYSDTKKEYSFRTAQGQSTSLGGNVTYVITYGSFTENVTVTITKITPVENSLNATVDSSVTIYPTSSDDTVRSALTVKVDLADGQKGVTVTDYTIDSYTLAAGTVTLTISYTRNGVTVSTTAEITVTATTIASIKAEFTQNDDVIYTSQNIDDLKDKLVVKGIDGENNEMGEISDYTLSVPQGYWIAGNVTVTVTYTNDENETFTDTFVVRLTAYAISGHQAELNKQGLTLYEDYVFADVKDDLMSRAYVTGTWTDGEDHSNEYTFTVTDITGSDGGSSITVAYTVTANTVGAVPSSHTTVINLDLVEVETVGVNVKPIDGKTLYTSNALNDVTTATKLYLVKNSGAEDEIDWAGDNTNTVSYNITAAGWANGGNVTVSIDVTVNDKVYPTVNLKIDVVKVALKSLSATYTQTGTVYETGSLTDVLNNGTLTVTGTNNDGTSVTPVITVANLSGSLTAGTATEITVTVDGITTTFEVNVTAVEIDTFTAVLPDTYNLYATTDLNKLAALLTVTATYTDGKVETLAYGDGGYSFADGTSINIEGSEAEDITVTVNYKDASTDVTVTVQPDELTNFAVTFTQGSAVFYKNGGFGAIKDSTNLTVVATYQNNGAVSLKKDQFEIGMLNAANEFVAEGDALDGDAKAELPDGGDCTLAVKYTYGGVEHIDKFIVNITKKAQTGIAATFTLNDGAVIYTSDTVASVFYGGEGVAAKGKLEVVATYNDGDKETLVYDKDDVTKSDYTVNHSYGDGKLPAGTATFTVVSTEDSTLTSQFSFTVSDVQITSLKAKWVVDGNDVEKLDVFSSTTISYLQARLVVIPVFNDGSESTALTTAQYSITRDFSKLGETTITVTDNVSSHNGVSCTVPVVVSEVLVNAIEITYGGTVYTSTKESEIRGSSLLEVIVKFNDPEHASVKLDNSEFELSNTDFFALGAGTHTIGVKYIGTLPKVDGDVTGSLEVTVNAVEVDTDTLTVEYKGNVVIHTDTALGDVKQSLIDAISHSESFNDGKTHAVKFTVTDITYSVVTDENDANISKWRFVASYSIASDVAAGATPEFVTYTNSYTFDIEISYSIIYNGIDLTNGQYTNPNPAEYFVSDGDITLAEATRNGYTFGGWYSDAAHTEANKVTTITVADKAEVTLYAKWELTAPTLSFDNTSVAYTGSEIEFKVTIGNYNENLVYTYNWVKVADDSTETPVDGDSIKLTNVSDTAKYKVTVHVTNKEGDANGEATSDVVTFEVTKADNELTTPIAITGWTFGEYDATANAPSAEAKFGNDDIVFKVNEKNLGTYEELTTDDQWNALCAGTHTIIVVIAGTDNYNDFESRPAQFTVTKRDVEVPTIDSKTYDGTTLKSDLTDTDDYTILTNDGGTDAGEYDVVVSLKDKDSTRWKGIGVGLADEVQTADQTLKFKILKADNKIENLAISGWTYGEYNDDPIDENNPTNNLPTATALDGTIVYLYSASETEGYAETVPTDAGTYYVKATVAASKNWNEVESAPVKFVIAKQTVVAPTSGGEATYTGSTITSDVPNEANGLYTVTQASGISAGNYDVLISLTDKDNYRWSDREGAIESNDRAVTFTIKQATDNAIQSVTGVQDWVFGSEPVNPTATAHYGDVYFVYSTAVDGDYVATVPTNVGTYYVKAKVDETDDYNGCESANSYRFSITKANDNAISGLAIADWTYGGLESIPTATAKYGQDAIIYKYSNAADGTYDAALPENAGTYFVKAYVEETANYSGAESEAVEFRVLQATATISGLSIQGWVEGATAKQPTAVSNFGTIVYSYSTSANGNYTTTVPTAAGTYYVKATVAATNNWKAAESAPVMFTINRKQIEQGGVTITGEDGILPDLQLVVDPVEPKTVKIKGEEIVGAFDIAVNDKDGNKADLKGQKIIVRLLIDEGYRDREDLRVMYYGDDGTVEDMNATKEGDFMVFETTHFSMYVITYPASGASAGEIAGLSVGAVVDIALIAAAVVLFLKFRKRGQQN